MTEFERVKRCAKHPVDVWTTYVCYFFSLRLVYAVRRIRWITPNALTLFALVLAIVGGACFAVGTRPWLTAGLILVQLGYVFDCADGQLARYRQQFSPIGVWLDMVCDRVKEFLIYLTLALGYQRTHPGAWDIWVWAMISVFALHFLEYYEQIREKSLARVLAPLSAVSSAGETTTAGAGVKDVVPSWRRLVPFRGFNIGEQYLVLAIFLAFGAVRPLLEFVAVFGALMCIYRPAVLFWKSGRARRRLSAEGEP